MASFQEITGELSGKATELGKKGFSLYLEMVDNVMDSVVGLVDERETKLSHTAAKALNSDVVRKSVPYVVLVNVAFDLNHRAIKKHHEKRREKKALKKEAKAIKEAEQFHKKDKKDK